MCRNARRCGTLFVTRGLDPCVHHLKKMDCRIKSGNDGGVKAYFAGKYVGPTVRIGLSLPSLAAGAAEFAGAVVVAA